MNQNDKRETQTIDYQRKLTDPEILEMSFAMARLDKEITDKRNDLKSIHKTMTAEIGELETQRLELSLGIYNGFLWETKECYVERDYAHRTIIYYDPVTVEVVLVEPMDGSASQTTLDELTFKDEVPTGDYSQEPDVSTQETLGLGNSDDDDEDMDTAGHEETDISLFFDETVNGVDEFYFPQHISRDVVQQMKPEIIASDLFITFYNSRDQFPEDFYYRFFGIVTAIMHNKSERS